MCSWHLRICDCLVPVFFSKQTVQSVKKYTYMYMHIQYFPPLSKLDNIFDAMIMANIQYFLPLSKLDNLLLR